MLDEAACEEAYLAIADMIDMRMPFTFVIRARSRRSPRRRRSRWAFLRPTSAMSAARPTRTTSVN
jgi:hypothetical protein